MAEHPHDPTHGDERSGQAGPPVFADPAQESLSQALRTGFNLLRLLMIVLVVAYFLSGFFQVGPGEQGVVVRFGRLLDSGQRTGEQDAAGSAVFGPGWHLSLPDPFDEKILVSGTTHALMVETFLFDRSPDSRGKPLVESAPQTEKIDPKVHGTMITGDRNLAHGLWSVEYRIADAERFVKNVGESRTELRPLLRRLLESAVIQTVAGLSVERVTVQRLAQEAGDFTETVKRRLERELERFETGVAINKVTAETTAPGSVREAFLDVTRAQSEAQKLIADARSERVRILSETAGPVQPDEQNPDRIRSPLLDAIDAYGAAQTAGAEAEELAALRERIESELERSGGRVAGRLREAQTRASRVRQQLEQEYTRFANWREQFQRQPQAVAAQLWTEMRAAVLDNLQNEVFYVTPGDMLEILINRDPERIIERERDRLRQRRQ